MAKDTIIVYQVKINMPYLSIILIELRRGVEFQEALLEIGNLIKRKLRRAFNKCLETLLYVCQKNNTLVYVISRKPDIKKIVNFDIE